MFPFPSPMLMVGQGGAAALPGGALVGRGTGTFSGTSGDPVSFNASAVYDRTSWYDGTNKLIVPSGVALVRPVANIHQTQTGADSPFRWKKSGADYAGAGKAASEGGNNNIIGAINAVSAADYFQLVKDSTSNLGPESDNTWFGIEALDAATKYCLVTKTGSQTITSSGAAITFGTEVADVGGWFNSATSTTLMVVPSGVTRVRVTAGWISPTTGSSDSTTIVVQKNGASFRATGSRCQSANSAKAITATTAVLDVVAGDTFNLFGVNSTSVSISSTTQIWLCIEEVPDYKRTVAYRTTTLSIPASTPTVIPWTNALTDTAGNFSAGTTLTVPSGVTQARYSFGLDLPNGTDAGAFITGRPIGSPSGECITGSSVVNGLGMWVDVSPGDTRSLQAFDTSAVTFADNNNTWFCAEYR